MKTNVQMLGSQRHGLRLAAGMFFACFVLAAAAADRQEESQPPLLRSIEAIRRLSREEAAQQQALCVSGTVTYRTAGRVNAFIVDDGKVGIYCNVGQALERKLLDPKDESIALLNVGTQVEVKGFTDPGNFAPVVVPTAFRVIGYGPLPEPKRADIQDLFSGKLDSQRVSVEGVVRVATKLEGGGRGITLHIGTLFDRFQVVLLDVSYKNPERLVDARVRVNGCMLPIFNARWEVMGVSVQTNLREDLHVLEPARSDPFDHPVVSLADLRPFSIEDTNLHRHKVRGIVTVCHPGDFLYLQEGHRSARISLASKNVFESGDLVEAIGFVNFRSAITRLESAYVRKIGTGRVPEPITTTIGTLLASGGDPSQKPDVVEWNGVVVSVEGQVVGMERRGPLVWFTLGINNQFITASLPLEKMATVDPAIKLGAFLNVMGVADVNYRVSSPTGDWVETASVIIHMRGPSDIQTLRYAPWWTPQRVNWTIGLLIALIAAGLLWIAVLRRVVASQSTRLELAMRVHRDAELEFEATKRERLRLAHDLHDGFQQLLAGTMFRLKAAVNYLPDAPAEAQEQLESARESLRHTQSGLRNALWGLTEEAEGPPDLVGLLKHAVRRIDHWQGVVDVQCEGKERPMSRHLMGSLLMVVQEAVGNALRHGGASQVTVRVRFDEEGLTLNISDNGSGFDPHVTLDQKSGHLGLGGMRDRIRWLGGTFSLTSKPGEGTKIVAYLAWEQMTPTLQAKEGYELEAPQPVA